MQCYLSEEDSILEGYENVNVIKRASGVHEVWCQDFETMYGFIPLDFPPESLNVAMNFWHAAERIGQEYGKRLKAIELRRALGIDI